MSSVQKIVVVGAGAAGLACTEELRTQGYDSDILLIGGERHLPYDRPPLSKKVLSGEWELEKTLLKSDGFYSDNDIRLRLGVKATALNAASRTIKLDDGEVVSFDKLLIATGVVPKMMTALKDGTNVHVIRTVDQSLALRASLVDSLQVAIVGAGILGMEIAATLQQAGHEVTVYDSASTPMLRQFGPQMGKRIAGLHRGRGVKLSMGIFPVGVEPGDDKMLRLSDGSTVHSDLTVVAIGSYPAIGWLEGSGLSIRDGVACDGFCQAAQDVYAAGDVSSWPHPYYGTRLRLEHRTNASEQGVVAARNMIGRSEAYNPVPFFWTDQYDVKLQAYGLLYADADVTYEVGDMHAEKFVATFRREGRLEGVLGWNAVKDLRPFRQRMVDSITQPET